jgi:hypothetical protein
MIGKGNAVLDFLALQRFYFFNCSKARGTS